MFCLLHIRIYSFNNRGMQIIWWVEKKFHFSQKQYSNDPYESRVLMEMAGFEKFFRK